MKFLFLSFITFAVSVCAESATYSRTDSLDGQSFLDAFFWQAIADPTWGRVYVAPSVTDMFA